MAKLIGYILALIGLLGIGIYTVPEMNSYTGIPTQFLGTPLLIVGIVLIVLVLFFVVKGGRGGRQAAEVPIYHGKNLVGYRRH